MIRSKNLLSYLVLPMLVAVALVSQPLAAQPSQRAERIMQKLKDSLALTEVQIPKVQAVVMEYQEEMQAGREKGMGDRDAMMALIRERSDKLNKQIDSLLTPAQQEKFKTMKFGMPNQMRQRMGDRSPEGRRPEGMPGNRDGM